MKRQLMLQAAAALALLVSWPQLAAAETHVVIMDAMKFQPASLVVRRGDTVVWRNKDIVPHTATAAGTFDSGRIDNGREWSWTAGTAGRIDYVCTYHPGMTASVEVR